MKPENEKMLCVLAKEALQVQDACNLSGVVHSFSRVMADLSAIASAEGFGTDWKNSHPVAVLFADKCAHLTGIQADGGQIIGRAYDECDKLLKVTKVTEESRDVKDAMKSREAQLARYERG